MEEKKIKGNQKLSYEQLEAYAAQTTEQAKRILQENQVLKKALYEQSLKEIELALKCLDHSDKFSKEFIDKVVSKIEELMTPKESTETSKEE